MPIHIIRTIKPALEKFDIIAARPQDDKALERLLDEEIDIISLDGGLKSAYFLKKELIKKVMVKDLVFELEYAPCVSDSSVMGNTIQLAQDLLTFCKGKNLILSSGHSNPLYIRGPYDVINLAVLFGLPTNLAKETVFGGALNVVKYAEGRKSLSVNIDIKPKKSLEEPAEPMKRPVETGEHHQPAVKKFKSWS
ncbi:RPP30 [Bugula neritina]|uniref:RPP30 n=1 Tax=Bugula neritina TaxID=10212 RepID=A0A7J7K6A6_BUGNE|nr:RPP30 [Bugula neritina]